jgi:diketogulonate reductase-like aldo/keto reductase
LLSWLSLLFVVLAVLVAMFRLSLRSRSLSPPSTTVAPSMSQRTHAFGMPLLLYGTAWKGDRTDSLLRTALNAGFAGFDTASQPKHYREDLVGDALQQFAVEDRRSDAEELVRSGSLWVQSKFTPLDGQDRTRPLPYDASASIGEQVMQSFNTTQRHLAVVSVSALVLHSPYQELADTLEAWAAMSALHDGQLVDHLGISNIYDPLAFAAFFDAVSVKPRFVQNHLHRQTRHLRALLPVLAARNCALQLFWTLTGNPHVLSAPEFVALARQHALTPAELFYAFLLQRGLHADVPVTILDGTTNASHMAGDLKIAARSFDVALRDDELASIRALLFQPGA